MTTDWVAVTCPFCGEDEFDHPGLHYHLRIYCVAFQNAETAESWNAWKAWLTTATPDAKRIEDQVPL